MDYYAGIDVSLEESSICVVDAEGTSVCELKIKSDPLAIARALKQLNLPLKRVGLEAGPLAPWLHAGLRAAGLPAICVETRHMKSALGAMRNKTDKNDARGIAQMMRTGWFRAVHVKRVESHEARLLLTNRSTLQSKALDLESCIRGTLKAFGLKVGKVSRAAFDARVRDLIADREVLKVVMLPMLQARSALVKEFGKLDRLLRKTVRNDPVCRQFMTAPGVGPVTALAFKTGVDHPERFTRSRNVGAHFGLTPRAYASGEVDYNGHISKCGDAMVRSALYEAANSLLVRTRRWSALKAWGMKIAKRAGLKRARVAVARKLAAILHRMWLDGSEFRWSLKETAAA